VRRRPARSCDWQVLLLAAGADTPARVAGLDAGADDCLAWPLQTDELSARVRALVRRRHRREDGVVRCYDLQIDTVDRVVRRGGRVIHLTPREYALLEFLASHRGKVVTRSVIRDHLYGGYGENTSNVVDVYIRYLRNKVDKGFDPQLILTRWGEGYTLRGDDDPPRGS